MSEPGRACATCVFWSPRGERGGQSSGRCRGQALVADDPRQVLWTQAEFACAHWCPRPAAVNPVQAAE